MKWCEVQSCLLGNNFLMPPENSFCRLNQSSWDVGSWLCSSWFLLYLHEDFWISKLCITVMNHLRQTSFKERQIILAHDSEGAMLRALIWQLLSSWQIPKQHRVSHGKRQGMGSLGQWQLIHRAQKMWCISEADTLRFDCLQLLSMLLSNSGFSTYYLMNYLFNGVLNLWL